jgi:hypothetical protein
MKMMNNLNNLSEIYSLLESSALKSRIFSINKNEMIDVNSHLIHKEDCISYYDNVIFNLDNYISFIKNHLFINPFELKYILELTINCNMNNIFFDKTYYYDNLNHYQDEFVKLFMYKYEINYNILKKHISIKHRNFLELVNNINKHKKRVYSYFDDINQNNLLFHIAIIENLEDITS